MPNRKSLERGILPSGLKFITVRHPFTRLYSAWRDKFKVESDWLGIIQQWYQPLLERIELELNLTPPSGYEYSFQTFLELVAMTEFDFQRDRHFQSIASYWLVLNNVPDCTVKSDNFGIGSTATRVYELFA